MVPTHKRVWKSLGLVAVLGALALGVALLIFKDNIALTHAPCATVFSSLDSENPSIKGLARKMVDLIVREKLGVDKDSTVNDEEYSKATSELNTFCQEHPALNMQDLRKAFLGVD
ncbi:MAG: hypothetical protein M3N08_02105 [Pseudomonadota bacterium]|nr:hypothetical protein [Pseudomonadota bacterium]